MVRRAEQVVDAFPTHVAPMLAVTGTLPADSDAWAFEYKWDGIRALCYWDGRRIRLESRNLRDITGQYPELTAWAEELGPAGLVLDGEIVAPDERGRPSFRLLQRRMHLSSERSARRAVEIPAEYFVFDVLWHDGRGLMDEPYRLRRRELERLDLRRRCWRVPPSHVGEGAAMLAAAKELRLEGLIAKRVGSTYRPGQRSGDWVKIKLVHRQEFVVGGWEPRAENVQQVGSLLAGYYEGGRLHFAGRVGTGFSAQTHRQLLAAFRPLERTGSPFVERVDGRLARYVEPRLVADVEYRRWPADGQLQQAAFMGLRDDKPPREVVKEDAGGG